MRRSNLLFFFVVFGINGDEKKHHLNDKMNTFYQLIKLTGTLVSSS